MSMYRVFQKNTVWAAALALTMSVSVAPFAAETEAKRISAGTEAEGTITETEAEGAITKTEEITGKEMVSMSDVVKETVWPYYEAGAQVAIDSPDSGRNFTDHKTEHALMVSEKSLEAGRALASAIERGVLGSQRKEDRITLGGDIDWMVIEAAGLSHDMGMCGGGYALTDALDDSGKPIKDEKGKTVFERDTNNLYKMHKEDNLNFGEVRSYHSLNSGLYVLVNRERYRAAGFTDEQIDRIAIICMAHSKSTSGVRDLNSKADWKECFDRLDSVTAAWNADHANEQISFDRTPFETNDEKLGNIVSETLAIRLGDVSRDSGPDAEAQSGEKVHVDRSTINDHGGSIEEEVADASITIGENNDPVPTVKSQQVHAGEQNICYNRTFVNLCGGVTHEITVTDGCSAPRCTQEAVNDHLGELASVKDEKFDVAVVFTQFSSEDEDYFRNSWEDFRLQAAQDYPNVTVRFPWDKEEKK